MMLATAIRKASISPVLQVSTNKKNQFDMIEYDLSILLVFFIFFFYDVQ